MTNEDLQTIYTEGNNTDHIHGLKAVFEAGVQSVVVGYAPAAEPPVTPYPETGVQSAPQPEPVASVPTDEPHAA